MTAHHDHFPRGNTYNPKEDVTHIFNNSNYVIQ